MAYDGLAAPQRRAPARFRRFIIAARSRLRHRAEIFYQLSGPYARTPRAMPLRTISPAIS